MSTAMMMAYMTSIVPLAKAARRSWALWEHSGRQTPTTQHTGRIQPICGHRHRKVVSKHKQADRAHGCICYLQIVHMWDGQMHGPNDAPAWSDHSCRI